MSIHAPNTPVNRWVQPAPSSWTQFALWAIVGPILIAGLLATFTPLIVITTPIGGLVIWAIGSAVGVNCSVWGAVTGVGIGALALGLLSPLWFLSIVGLVLILAGVVVFETMRNVATRRARAPLARPPYPSNLP